MTGWRRDVAIAATGRGVSLVGDEVAVVALMLAVSHRPGGGLLVAALLAAAALPALLLAPVAGLLVDRLPARRLLATAGLLQSLLCVVLVLTDSSWAIVAVVLLLNAVQAVASPAWQALLPSVVPADRLPGALSTIQSVTAVAGMLGPAVGGLLVGLGGTTLALGVDAVSFLLLALAATRLSGDRVPEPSPDAVGEPWYREAMVGLRLVVGDRLLRALFGLLGVFILALGAVNVAEVFLVTQVLGAGAIAYGLVGATFAGGLLLGSLVGRRRLDDGGLARSVALAVTVMALGILALGLSPGVLVAAAATVVIGAGNAVLNIGVQQLVIRRAPAEARGRVFATLQAVVNAALLVALATGGVLLGVLGARELIVGSAVVGLAALALAARPLVAAARQATPAPQPSVAELGGA